MANIFVVDDDDYTRATLVAMLSTAHEVKVQASSFSEAVMKIQQVKKEGCMVALVDGSLGSHRGDGQEIAQCLKKEIPGIRIVACSGEERKWGDANLLKPVLLKDLLMAVEG